MASSERDAFYECFWATPELPTPQIKGDVLAAPLATNDAALTPAMANLRLTLKNRLKLIELSREDELLKAIELCRRYSRLLQADEFHSTAMVSCRWKSCFTANPTDMPLLFELPMVLFTRAVLLLNQAKCVSRSRDRERIPVAVALCLEAAGIFDHIVERMNAHLIEGIEPPSVMPDLSLDLLQSMNDICLAIAQQLSIVKAVLHFDKTYSKSVLVKLHGGCQASLQTFETALQRNCGSVPGLSAPLTSSPSSSRHAKTLFAFASFFSKLHRAQAFLLTAEVEYQARNVGRAVAFLAVARKLFQDRSSGNTSGNGLGLAAPPSYSDRLVPVLAAKRAALDELLESWTQENESIYLDMIPTEESVLSTALPQAFVMKPQPFDARHDNTPRKVVDAAPRLQPRTRMTAAARDRQEEAAERIQVIDEHSDEENDAASENEVYLERINIDDRRPSSLPPAEDSQDPETPAPLLQATRQSLIHALSDALQASHPEHEQLAVLVAPTRRQSERAPSATTAQIASIAERAARRKKSAGVEYKSEASKANAEIVGAQERFKAVALQERLQPPRAERGGERGGADYTGMLGAVIQVMQPKPALQGMSEADEHMHAQLARGKPIFRLAKDTRWRKETMFLVDDELLFVRKKPLLFSTQKKVSWSTVQAVQLEQGEIKDTHFILLVAKKGEEMTPFEITSSPPGDNPALFQYLHRLFQEKRKKSVLPAAGVGTRSGDMSASDTNGGGTSVRHAIH